MRTAGQADDSGTVDHLVEDHDVVGRLNDLHVVVVRARHHRRSRVEPEDAAFRQRTLFRVVVPVSPLFGSLLGFGSQWRDAAIRRIHDQRGLLRDPRPEIPPEVVVRTLDVGGGAAVAPILVGRLDSLLGKFFGFLVCHRLFAGEVARPLEWGELSEVPRALQIRATVGCSRHRRHSGGSRRRLDDRLPRLAAR
ncbi:MAG: hypothetical protein DMF94_23480 [Acidobacteria bacterium]|nr:MAG: hypothetical protein DMF94_23480 [Acidobacteriota bacterium]